MAVVREDYSGAFLGRLRQGQYLPLFVWVRDHLRHPAWPDTAPTAYIYGDSGSLVIVSLPVLDPSGNTGVFSRQLFLNQQFPGGRYRVTYRWTVGGVAGGTIDTFEVVGGGDPAGAVISLYAYDRPEARYVLAQVGAGRLIQGRNPKL